LFNFLITKLNSNEFRNIKALLLSYVLKYSIGLVINLWIVRSLGDENYGIFSYVNSVAGVFGIISTFGLQTVVITSLLKSNINNQRLVISNAFLLSLTTGVIAALSQFGFVLYYNYMEKSVIILCFINVLVYLFDTFKVLTYYYESKVESAKVAKINNISYLICTIFRIFILYKKMNIYYLALSYVLDYIIIAILLYRWFPPNLFKINKIIFNKNIFIKLFENSLPYLFTGLFINFFMKIDLIMIKNLLNNTQTGIFAASVRLTEIWYFIPGIIQSTFFPNLFENKENLEMYDVKIRKFYKFMFLFSLTIIFITIVFGKLLIIKLFGQEFSNAYNPLVIHIWSLLFVSISVVRNSYLLVNNLTKIFFQIHVIGAVTNVILCYLFIKQFGIIGASMATVFSYFIVAYATNFIYKPLHSEIKNINYSVINFFRKF
jgi:O-antigen/teichoic acid export membrane protein